ncbi:MAG: hypothetical protein R2856_18365 [Caldilineaceae bacterium]
MTTSMKRVHARGWTVLEADTVHQILPDPLPKAEVILKASKPDLIHEATRRRKIHRLHGFFLPSWFFV